MKFTEFFSNPGIFWKKNEKWVRFFILGAQINRKIDFTIDSFLGGILRSIVEYPKNPDFLARSTTLVNQGQKNEAPYKEISQLLQTLDRLP